MKIINKTTIILLTMAWLFMSCTNNNNHREHNHEHEGHVHHVELSAYQQGLEAFVKFKQPIINESTHIDLYITDTETGKNAADNPVTFRFLNNQMEKELIHQDKNGIYYIDVVFSQPEVVDLQILYIDKEKELTFDLGEFLVWESKEVMEEAMHHEHGEDKAEHHEEEREAGLVEFNKLQQWYIGLKTENPQFTEICTTISCIGKILPLPERKAKVSSPYGGKIIFPPNFNLKIVGEKVKKGDILAVIQPLAFSPDQVNTFNLIMEEQKVKLLMDKAHSEYVRAEKLYQENIISKKRLIEAKTEYEIYKKNYENIKSLKTVYFQEDRRDSSTKNQQQYYYVKAPIDGILACTHIFRGEFIEPHEELCQIIDPRKVWLELQVHEKDILKTSSNKTATVLIKSAGQQWQIPPKDAQLISLGISLNKETRTLPIVYELRNPNNHFKIGMIVDVTLSCPSKKSGMVIPEKALIEMEGVPYVFVKVSEEKFMRRMVEIVKLGAGTVQVLKGIKAKDRIVVKGVYNLKLASLKAVIPSAHEGHQH